MIWDGCQSVGLRISLSKTRMQRNVLVLWISIWNSALLRWSALDSSFWNQSSRKRRISRRTSSTPSLKSREVHPAPAKNDSKTLFRLPSLNSNCSKSRWTMESCTKNHLIPSLRTPRSSKKWRKSSLKDSPSPPKVSEESRLRIQTTDLCCTKCRWNTKVERTKTVGGFVPTRNVRCLYGDFRKRWEGCFKFLWSSCSLVETRIYPEWGKPGCQARAGNRRSSVSAERGLLVRKVKKSYDLFSTHFQKVKCAGPWNER